VGESLHFWGFGGVRIDLKRGSDKRVECLRDNEPIFFLNSLGGRGFKESEFEISNGHFPSPNFIFIKIPKRTQKPKNSNIPFNNLRLSHGHKKKSLNKQKGPLKI
jgi:hypothetical protein